MHDTSDPDPAESPRARRLWRYLLIVVVVLPLLTTGLIAFNGWTSDWRTPRVSQANVSAPASVSRVRVVAYNLAKLGAERALPLRSTEEVEAHLDEIAALLRSLRPDVVVLSEAAFECTPCDVNQVAYLAEATGLRAWVFGENMNFGLPFLRLRSGNAVLSRFPLRPLATVQLPQPQPILWPANNRRLLWCETQINGGWVRVGSVHNDSFDPANNALQVEEILSQLGGEAAVLAGDFNAKPREPQIKVLRDSGKFVGEFAGEFSFPAHAPPSASTTCSRPRAGRTSRRASSPASCPTTAPSCPSFESTDAAASPRSQVRSGTRLATMGVATLARRAATGGAACSKISAFHD